MSDMHYPPFPLPEPPEHGSVLADLFPEFVQAWITDIDQHLQMFAVSHDTEALYRLGHTIKGSFQQFGLEDHASIGRAIMDFATSNIWDDAIAWLEALRTMLCSLQAAIHNAS